jgi:haloalkane dehalogenase
MTVESGPQSSDNEISYQEKWVSTAPAKIYVRDYPGTGPAFVMMHGFPDNMRIFEKVAPFITFAGRKVVLFDFLGFGASDKPGEGYSFEQQVGDLVAVADTLGLDRIVPVAHDAGGPAAVNFALRYPQRTAGVALINSFYANAPTLRFPEFIGLFTIPSLKALSQHFLQNPKLFAELQQFQRDQFCVTLGDAERDEYDEFLAPLIEDNFRRQPGAGPAFAQMTGQALAEIARNDEHLGKLGQLDVPFRLIWGAEDPYLNTGVAENLAGHLRTATTTILDGAGHWPQIDRPADVARALLSDTPHAD